MSRSKSHQSIQTRRSALGKSVGLVLTIAETKLVCKAAFLRVSIGTPHLLAFDWTPF